MKHLRAGFMQRFCDYINRTSGALVRVNIRPIRRLQAVIFAKDRHGTKEGWQNSNWSLAVD